MQWEYHIELLNLGNEDAATSVGQLNDLGVVGWELVSVVNKLGKDDSWTAAFLKREKRQDRK